MVGKLLPQAVIFNTKHQKAKAHDFVFGMKNCDSTLSVFNEIQNTLVFPHLLKGVDQAVCRPIMGVYPLIVRQFDQMRIRRLGGAFADFGHHILLSAWSCGFDAATGDLHIVL